MIYAQGSIATSTTIVSGTNDDRFDVDAIVEINVPHDWSDTQALDLLEEALQGFPGVIEIERCTRCVQMKFPFMHMDVTIMDRRERIAVMRAGEIFHSPDDGNAYRVPSNPWGFTGWFRSKVGLNQKHFSDALRKHRKTASVNRLKVLDESERIIVCDAEQLDLPPMIPSALDAQEAVALKLLKRFMNRHYEDLSVRRPPSIYLTKRAGDVQYFPQGLTAQLYALALSTAQILRDHLEKGTRPEETNPSYHIDKINDRWPTLGTVGDGEMKACAEALEHLVTKLQEMTTAPLADISKIIDELFGENIGKQHRKVLMDRYDRREKPTTVLTEPRTGAVTSPAIITSTPEKNQYREVPRHNFHPMTLDDDNDET